MHIRRCIMYDSMSGRIHGQVEQTWYGRFVVERQLIDDGEHVRSHPKNKVAEC